MANTIQIKRGLNANLPTLAEGELAFSTDTYELHIGDGTNNHEIVMYDLFDANTILAATSDNTPAALTVPEQTLVGRITSGNIAALTAAQVRTLLNVEDGADVTDATNVDAAGAVMESDFDAQTILAAISDNTPTALTVGEQTVVGRITSGNVTALTGANLWTILTGQAGADVSMNSHKLTSVADPTSAQDAATKTYVDSLVAHGLTWHEAVLDKDTLDPSGLTPTSGDRYWIGGTGAGDWSGHDYEIAQYNGTDWDYEAVTDGDAAYVTDENIVYFYDGDTTSLKELYTAIGDHAATHISGGSDEIDGDKLDIDWNPTNYTPSTSPSEADSVDDLTAHLAGIDDALASVGSTTWTGLTDTPSSISASYVVRGNSAGDALEMVDFGTTYLEDTPTDGETGKAPTSNWAYDHNAATTGVHGAGSNTLLHSGSTIDGGSF